MTFPDFLDDDSTSVAKQLLGCELVRQIDGQTVRVRIVETESYDQQDAASHSYKGKTPRTDVMFGPSGHLYVYFTYGMHYCCNIVTGATGEGSAVLIRAVEPIEGVELIEKIRGKLGVQATNGPAKLCKALGITREMNGHDLHRSPLQLIAGELRDGETISASRRVGISIAQEAKRRFYITGNPFVSPYLL